MKTRVISAIVFGLIFFPAIYFGGIYFLIISLFCGYVGTFELMNMYYKRNKTLKAMRFIVPAFSDVIIFLMYMFESRADCYTFYYTDSKLTLVRGALTSMDWTSMYIMLLGLMLASFLLFLLVFFLINVLTKGSTAEDLHACITSLCYGGLLIACSFSLEYFKPIQYVGQSDKWGGQVLVYVYGVVCLTDIFAYLIGRKIGRHKLCPSISPKKSVEGAIGGMLCASILGTLIAFLCGCMPLSKTSTAAEIVIAILGFFLASMIISIISQFGDLAASKLKRTYEIKDFGNIMPGHGGIMDRFDSFILAGSFVYVFAMISKLIFLGFGL